MPHIIEALSTIASGRARVASKHMTKEWRLERSWELANLNKLQVVEQGNMVSQVIPQLQSHNHLLDHMLIHRVGDSKSTFEKLSSTDNTHSQDGKTVAK